MTQKLGTDLHHVVSKDEAAELALFLDDLNEIARETILPYFRTGLSIDDKGDGLGGVRHYDPVTKADKLCEEAVRAKIEEKYPEHGIFGEEHGVKPSQNGLTWVIDPIDGTRAFVTGMPLWGVLIGLYDGRKAVMGTMDQPYTGERFFGGPMGAYIERDGQRRDIKTSTVTDVAQASIYTTHPHMFENNAEKTAYTALAKKCQLERFGGDCYAYAMLAHGLIDIVLESSLQPYDIVALIPIVEAAGGVITTWSGGPAHNAGQVIAAATPQLHKQALSYLKDAAN
jgi:histidinol phosphatase-like enzyme (inositol monophosphatase family)